MSEPEPWEIALQQIRAEYTHRVPWRSSTELQDELVWAYGRLEETYKRVRKERAMSKETKQIGVIGVDAGLCWIGDPCYIWPDEDGPGTLVRQVPDWRHFCNKLNRQEEYTAFERLGIAVTSGLGDGLYPVYATFEDGVIASITVKFLEDEK